MDQKQFIEFWNVGVSVGG